MGDVTAVGIKIHNPNFAALFEKSDVDRAPGDNAFDRLLV